ncbi:MAG: HAMP domain-containing protein [Acidobacteria bacterium]|nr:MAG: HAMP domain-containing protein [Acidobacteriota bacterium]
MKIATKITAGYGTLIALMVGLLIYLVSVIHQMVSINQSLSHINFRAAMTALQLMRDLDQLENDTRKFLVTRDPGYANKVAEMHRLIIEDLRILRATGHAARERTEIETFDRLWQRYLQVAARPEQPVRAGDGGATATPISYLESLRLQADILIRVTQQEIASQVQSVAVTGKRAEFISWVAGAIALGLSVLVSLLITRSILKPLDQLTEGTRALAQGNFSYHLDIPGDDKLAQLARDFNTMTERLGELDQMKKDFISHVSHELKAPLASMQEITQLLLDEIPGPLTEKQKHFLQLNLQSGRRLSAMIGNLLDLSRMEAGVMDYQRQAQDIIALVRTALAEAQVLMDEKHLRLETELPPHPLIVECDGDRIIQVIRNLLDNALKFSPPGGTIGVKVSALTSSTRLPTYWRERFPELPPAGGYVLIAISDSGPGVPDAHKEKIFQKFHQVKQGRKLPGQGVGLGLAICRTIVEAHQGAIWVEDNEGGGSIFYVLLPTRSVHREVPSPAPSLI